MKRNRLIAFILALILTLGLSVPAMAASSDFDIGPDRLGKECLKKYNGSGGDVVIPDGVEAIGSAFMNRTDVISVVIPDGVTSIYNHAFSGCTNLKSITIPASITERDETAFNDCDSLTDIYYSGTQEQWKEFLFEGADKLRIATVHCSDGIIYPKDYYFTSDSYFETENGVLVSFGSYSSDVVIPDGITGIQNECFSGISGLKSVTIPDSVTDIGEDTFSWCENLTSVRLPSGITKIGNGVFSGCKSLADVNIPSGVTEIGNYAFMACNSLTGITIPSGVTEIGDSAFAWCSGLTSITIPSSVTRIGDSAFDGCFRLSSITIPSGVTKLGGTAFTFCYDLKSISIPASVKEITDLAFYSCDSLTDIYFGGTKEQWEAIKITKYNDELGTFEGVKAEDTPLFTATVHFGSGGSKPGTPSEQPTAVAFTDVPDGVWFTEPVKWAVGRKITNGTTTTTFSPYDTCTNAHILTFLWRAKGKPEVAEANTFTDVPDNAYYSKAALWAKSLGMISGTTMSPEAPCTRASTVTFMWKAAGSPSVSTKTGFTDVPADADYATAVAWAFENKITTGASATTFNPTGTCTRAEIVTFLYRAKDI